MTSTIGLKEKKEVNWESKEERLEREIKFDENSRPKGQRKVLDE